MPEKEQVLNLETHRDIESSKQFNRKLVPQDVLQVGSLTTGCRQLSDRKIELTQNMAANILEMKEWGADRPLSQAFVAYLITAMQRGTFHPEWVQLITCKLGDELYRMNGQHTCWARLEMPSTYECKVRLMEYEAETEDDMRLLYSSIDRNKGRNPGNVLVSILYGTKAFEGITQSTVKMLGQGLSFWLWPHNQTWDKTRRQHDANEVAHLLMSDHYTKAMAICGMIGTRQVDAAHLWRQPVVAAMFETLNKSMKAGMDDFWSVVSSGVGVDNKDDPRHRLRNFLLTNTMKSTVKGQQGLHAEAFYRSCILCWNAWCDGRTISVIRYSSTGERPKAKRYTGNSKEKRA